MFDQIAPTYDRANHLLSLSVDRYWRWRTVGAVRRALAGRSSGGGLRMLDICCGTGDLSLAVSAGFPDAAIVAADFSRPMLEHAQAKARASSDGRRGAPIAWLQADALQLPFQDNHLAAITTGFGFRNLSDYRAGLREFLRVLEPGGVLAILEISRPPVPVAGAAFQFYFTRILPRLGGWISGCPQAYRYLPESVGRFPAPPELAAWMSESGYRNVRFHRLAGGIASLHLGIKP